MCYANIHDRSAAHSKGFNVGDEKIGEDIVVRADLNTDGLQPTGGFVPQVVFLRVVEYGDQIPPSSIV